MKANLQNKQDRVLGLLYHLCPACRRRFVFQNECIWDKKQSLFVLGYSFSFWSSSWGSKFALFWFLLIRIQIIEIQLLVWCGHWTHWFVLEAFLYCLNVDIWTHGFHRKIAPAKIQSLYGSWRKQGFVKGSLSRTVRLRKYPLGVHPLYYIRP